MGERWPQAHLLPLWMAPNLAWMALWKVAPPMGGALWLGLGMLCMASMSGGLLLYGLAGPPEEAPGWVRPAIRGCFWVLAALAAWLVWSWWRKAGVAGPLVGLAALSWGPRLLSSAFGYSSMPDRVEVAQATSYPARSRGSWRHLLGAALALVWVALWAWAAWGADARIARPGSFAGLFLLGLGVVLAFQLSRLPPNWLGLGLGAPQWRRRDPATRLFWLCSLPSCLWLCGTQAYGLVRLFTGDALYFSMGEAQFSACLLCAALALLADPTGIVQWQSQAEGRFFVRRWGWVEEGQGSWDE